MAEMDDAGMRRRRQEAAVALPTETILLSDGEGSPRL